MIKRYTSVIFYSGFSLCIIAGCAREAIYVSPMNGATNLYIARPLQSDSIKSAIYGSLTYSSGNANDEGADQEIMGQGNIYRTHQFGVFQAYYGGNLSLGSYRVVPFSSSLHVDPAIDTSLINKMSGSKFFGDAGLEGGMAAVVPLRKSEWRVIGFSATLNKEFGQYLSFRKNLQYKSVTILSKSNLLGTIGISSEFTFHTRYGSWGFKGQQNFLLGKRYKYGYNDPAPVYGRFSFFSETFQLTAHQWTGYLQTNFGNYASSVQFGINYRFNTIKEHR